MREQPKPNIIFVDDEENVLRGINRMLRSRRNIWEVRYANGGKQALELMRERPADVVVSDMRMPGMDGAELLSLVQQEFPSAIRIVLSGFAERESILRTIGPSHRYLAKPSSEEAIIGSIESALQLRSHIQNPDLEKAVAGMRYIPTLPKLYTEILAELTAEHGSAERLASKIEQDVGMSAQLMKLTNSAYFSLPQPCRTVRQAITFLGFDNVRATILLAGVFEQYKNAGPELVSRIERLSHHSIAIGALAQQIARAEGWSATTADLAFCAGLLSHIGTLMMISHNDKGFTDTMGDVDNGSIGQLDGEMLMFGATHAQLGAYLLGLWSFSDSITEAVAYHHTPSLFTKSAIDVLTAVHVAQFLTRPKHKYSETNFGSGLDETYLARGGLMNRLPKWQQVYESVSKDWPG